MKFLVLISLTILLGGCDQIKWRMDGTAPEPAERANHVPFDTVATITLAGPRDRVERIIYFIVERDPEVFTLVEKRELR
jgi:hypothetical protein